MNRDELDQERPVPAAPARRLEAYGERRRRRPASTTSPMTDELDEIFGGLREQMVRRHVERSRRAARDLGLLTPAELEAMRANGVAP